MRGDNLHFSHLLVEVNNELLIFNKKPIQLAEIFSKFHHPATGGIVCLTGS